MSIVELRGVTKAYASAGGVPLQVLKGIDLDVAPGEFLALMGPSGSGKSTLMNLIGCIDRHDAGTYNLAGIDIGTCDDDTLAEVRSRKLGFVFQSFNLIPQLDVVENVALPLFYQRVGRKERAERAVAALEHVGLGHRIGHRPQQLSGGEQQRVAIARAVVTEPALLIGDEPTGALDSRTGQAILDLFHRLHAEGLTILMVTHDAGVGSQAERLVWMRDGLLVSQEERPTSARLRHLSAEEGA
ncbi:MAG: ABC transporter ATP-binding protein [Planctomycetota bacterium]|jgi:putative ABC transport system ATP-binding protein